VLGNADEVERSGILGNGAGLVMALDLVTDAGSKPAMCQMWGMGATQIHHLLALASDWNKV